MKFIDPLVKVIPCLSVLVFIMGGASLRIGDYPVLPALYLIPVYYWIIFCPQWLPLGGLFGIGLFYDALMGHELGFSSLLLMLSGFAGPYIRPLLMAYNFSVIWAVFGAYSFLFISMYGLFFKGGVPLYVAWFYGIVLYPFCSVFLNHIHLKLRAYV